MIVIGVDTHKRTHALAAVDECTGRVRGRREIKADEPGHLPAVRWARGLDEERVWAIEDCRAVSRRFEQTLLAAGERVVRVAPQGGGPPNPPTQPATSTSSSETRSRWSGPTGPSFWPRSAAGRWWPRS